MDLLGLTVAYDSDIETPEFPWHDVEDGTHRFREVGRLEWIYYV